MGDEPPTRRIPPSGRDAPPPNHDDAAVWRQQVRDRLRSLRTAVALVGVLALAALGVALYAALSDDDGGQSGSEELSSLQDRIDELEEQVDDRATKTSVSELRGQVEALRRESSDTEDTSDDVADLRRDLDELRERVDELEQQESTGGTPAPGTTPTNP